MIAAASENNALEKTMNWFGVYPTISKVQKTFRTSYIMGRKTLKVFQNHYLTEHIL
jgi:hypothetical protein